jgi:hypothetical protein
MLAMSKLAMEKRLADSEAESRPSNARKETNRSSESRIDPVSQITQATQAPSMDTPAPPAIDNKGKGKESENVTTSPPPVIGSYADVAGQLAAPGVDTVPEWLKKRRAKEAHMRKTRGPEIAEALARRIAGVHKKRPNAIQENRMRIEFLDEIDPCPGGIHKYGVTITQNFKEAFIGEQGSINEVEKLLGLQVKSRNLGPNFHIWFDPFKGIEHISDREALEQKMMWAREFLSFWVWRLGNDNQNNRKFTGLKQACEWWVDPSSPSVKDWIKLRRKDDPRTPKTAVLTKPVSKEMGYNEAPRIITREILTPDGAQVIDSVTFDGSTVEGRKVENDSWEGEFPPLPTPSPSKTSATPAKAGTAKVQDRVAGL